MAADYRVNEIFYSLQGEGRWTGTPVVFVRFAGCNLRCPFCDTEHSSHTLLTAADIVSQVRLYPARHVVLTGGEPVLQIDEPLLMALREAGFAIHIETNGTLPLAPGVEPLLDWITVSPKAYSTSPGEPVAHHPIYIQRVDELKVVFTDGESDLTDYLQLSVTHPECRYLQPCDMGDDRLNARILDATVRYILAHPQWRLSLQTHKLINIK